MKSIRASRVRLSRCGAVLVLMAFLLPVVLVICFFSVNLAYMLLLRTELRVATDAAARAAGSTFSSTNDEDEATEAGQQFALLNQVGGQDFDLADSDVEFGRSSQLSNGTRYEFVVDNGMKNSVRINATAASRALFADGLFYGSGFSPTQTATVTYTNVDICLVLDRSSSMKLYTWETSPYLSTSDARFCRSPDSDSRWMALEGAVDEFIDVLEGTVPAEYVAVVTYASDYSLPCSPSAFSPKSNVDAPLSGDLDNTLDAMEDLSSTVWGGMTEIYSGVQRATTVLTDPTQSRSNARKVMIVLTDGHYTGNNPVPYAADAAAEGIIVHAITFGDGANQQAMQAVAEAGGGEFYHAPDAETLEAVFRKLAAMAVLLTN